MSSIDLDKKKQEEIEQVLGYPLERLCSGKDFKNFVEQLDLDKSIRHQILDVLDSTITMPPDEAVRVIRSYLNERRKR